MYVWPPNIEGCIENLVYYVWPCVLYLSACLRKLDRERERERDPNNLTNNTQTTANLSPKSCSRASKTSGRRQKPEREREVYIKEMRSNIAIVSYIHYSTIQYTTSLWCCFFFFIFAIKFWSSSFLLFSFLRFWYMSYVCVMYDVNIVYCFSNVLRFWREREGGGNGVGGGGHMGED